MILEHARRWCTAGGGGRDAMPLNQAKQALLGLGQRAGLLRLARDSRWRDRRLLILCYHGVALEDEYQWNPSLYVSPATFERRLELVRRSGCTVLPFDDAIAALYAGSLPERSVTITFDDGYFDFYRVAHPRLSAAGFPAVVYLTTYHCDHNQPIYRLVCSYMLWKSRGRRLDLSRLVPGRPAVELEAPANRGAVLAALVDFAERNALSAGDKHAVARRLASELGLDFEALCARRFLHLLNPAEVTELAGRGVAFELHTHSHRSPSEELPYLEQVRRNRERVIEMTARRPVHFSYPSNVYGAQFIPWLEAEGLKTATTCEPGLASPASHPLLLPRLLDAETITDVEFEAWLGGAMAFGPRSARARFGLRKLARTSRARPFSRAHQREDHEV